MDELIHEPDVEMLQILDKDGNVVDEDRMPDLSEDELLELYRHMVVGRTADEKFMKLQRQGRFGTFAPVKGQEAAQIAPVYALREEDWMVPAFRETAAWPVRGLPLSGLIQYWKGDERGMQTLDGKNTFPVSVPVGSQVLHAAGSAWASKLRGEDSATICFFGDGATSEGDFHEGMNFAGAFNLPAVFVCQNNQYAISIPRKKQTAAQSLAQKAVAYGFPGIQVDGNDVFAMYVAAKEALERARNGDGPTLIEAYTYRLGDHTTADDASRYRTEDEVAEWKEKDPIIRFEAYLKEEGVLDEKTIEQIKDEAKEEVDAAVDEVENGDPPSVEDMFVYMYSEMPPRLQNQLDYLKELEDE